MTATELARSDAMYFPYDPDAMVPVSESHICEYHKAHPGEPWAGCMCWGSVGTRPATPEEYRTRRAERLTARRAQLETELRGINAELGELGDADGTARN